MALKLITSATELPVTLDAMKTALRIDGNERDAEVTWALHGAAAIASHEGGKQIMRQTYELTLDAFPSAIELTRVPVSSITSVTYADSAGAQTVLSSALYALDDADAYGFAYVVPAYGATWPTTRAEINAVKVRYVAGYAATSADVSPVDVGRINALMAMWVQDPTSLERRLSDIGRVYA